MTARERAETYGGAALADHELLAELGAPVALLDTFGDLARLAQATAADLHPGRKAYEIDGVRVIPCPAQFTDPRTGERSTYCERCNVCATLAPGGVVVGFSADRGTVRAVKSALA